MTGPTSGEMFEKSGQTSPIEVFTIGHSTLELSSFIEHLTRHEIACVCDVRRFAHSRRFPQFSRDKLATSLAGARICYMHVVELGGRRRPSGTRANAGWSNQSFRAYADHMASDEFARGFAQLETVCKRTGACVMCAEAAWWRCHRRLLADALELRGFNVIHIASDGRAQPHRRTPFLVVEGGRLRYPPTQATLEL